MASVARAVLECESAGAAGLHIEDQELPKRCGRLEGSPLIPGEDMFEKIRAARDLLDEMQTCKESSELL